MLDDLLLLAEGKVVYNGSIERATSYFTSIGYTNPDGINPADYMLELSQSNPATSGGVSDNNTSTTTTNTWASLFTHSSYNADFNHSLQHTLHTQRTQSSTIQPSSVTRFIYLLRYFMIYCIKVRGLYFYRCIALIFISVLVGTLFLNLQPTTDNISLYGKNIIALIYIYIYIHMYTYIYICFLYSI